ncbi:MAG: 3-deoxy-manno-octulosonate cytidylyltransferase [Gemmatimonadota bacterium]|nr:3-deoxy-manno-octulosonate cytidylyltransferase [Gemmatimonadota bacterium]
MVLAAIPARWESTRFPGKPMAELAGRPMIAWVVEAARGAASVDRVAVVTDHDGIGRAAEEAGARPVVREEAAASGSDRIGHLLRADPDAGRAEVVVNVQGDEPLIEPATIDAAVEVLAARPEADVATPVRAIRAGEDPEDPDHVKVAVAADGRALYFSRAPIPSGAAETIHVGLYAWRRAAFDRFVALERSPLERAERLEQLRALEAGMTIVCAKVETDAIGVDTRADLERATAAMLARLGRETP